MIKIIIVSNNNINLTVEMERIFWHKIVLNRYISPSNICPKCGVNSLKINDYNTIYNPLILICSSHKCRKIVFLRENTFYSLFPKTPISLIFYIHKLWFIEEKME